MSATDAERLAAGLDADEAAAKAAAGPEWFLGSSEDSDERSIQYTAPSTLHPGSVWDYCAADRVDEDDAAHIARHDPARAFREIAAKRAILALHEEFHAKQAQRTEHPKYAVEMGCEVLDQVVAALASVYTETGAATSSEGEPERTRMWRDLVGDRGIDRANRDWPALDPGRGGPGYARARLSSHHAHPTGANWAATNTQATSRRDNEGSKPGRAATAATPTLTGPAWAGKARAGHGFDGTLSGWLKCPPTSTPANAGSPAWTVAASCALTALTRAC